MKTIEMNKMNKMNTYKTNARIAGILLIAAIVAGVLSLVFLSSTQDIPVDLANIVANKSQVLLGSLFIIIMALACASIAVSMYPVLKKQNEGLALAAVGFRIIEGTLFIVGVITILLLLTLSQEFVDAGAPTDPYFQTLSELLLKAEGYAPLMGEFAFCLGALMYNYVFYQSKLIPRWISVLGFIYATLYITANICLMFGLFTSLSPISLLLHLPTMVGELVLAVWLIVKGFDLSTIVSESA